MNPQNNHITFSLAAFTPVFKAYLPSKHFRLFNFNNNETFSDGPWSPIMKMYGDKNALFLLINQYRSFPGSSTFFGIDMTVSLSPFPHAYESLKRNKFMYRQDLLCSIQRIVKELKMPTGVLINPVIGYYIKTKEYEIRESVELVPYPEEELAEFGKLLKQNLENIPSSYSFSDDVTVHAIFNSLKKLLPSNPRDPEYGSVLKLLKSTASRCSLNVDFYEESLNSIKIIIELIQKFIDDHPKLFKPDHPRGEADAPRVRLFELGKSQKKFCMAREILDELKKSKINAKVLAIQYEDMNILGTLDMITAMKMIGENAKKVEFIIVPIKHTKHRVLPIPSFGGRYCVHTICFIYEVIREIITVHGFYLNLPSLLRFLLRDIMVAFHTRILLETKGALFVDLEKSNNLKNELVAIVENIFAKENHKVVQDIREIGSDGFTLNNFNREMKRLGVTETFCRSESEASLVNNDADSAFRLFESTKKGAQLTTADMITLLENVQICCVLRDNSEIYYYIHSNDACGPIPQLCIYCRGRIPPVPSKTIEEKVPSFVNYTENVSFDGDLVKYFEPVIGMIGTGGQNRTSSETSSAISSTSTKELASSFDKIVKISNVESSSIPSRSSEVATQPSTSTSQEETPKKIRTVPRAYFFAALQAYLPKHHSKIILYSTDEMLFDSKSPLFGMYGNKERIRQDVQLFCSFPGSDAMYGRGRTEPYSIEPVIYKSASGKRYFYKQDVFKFLQLHIYNIYGNGEYKKLLTPMISFYFSCKEEKLRGCFDFVQYIEKDFKNFENSFPAEEHIELHTLSEAPTEIEYFNLLKKSLPKCDSDLEYRSIWKALKHLFKWRPLIENIPFYQRGLMLIKSVMKKLNNFVSEQADWFKRNEEVKSKRPAIVRWFADGDQKFVLAGELQREIERVGMGKKMKVVEMATMSIEEVKRKLGAQFKNFEFIITIVQRTAHRSVYIPGFDGNYMITTSDAIMEILHDIISVQFLFQNLEENQCHTICEILDKVIDHMEIVSRGARFINIDKVAETKDLISNAFGRDVPEVSAKEKQYVNKVDGFDVDDLKTEMVRLKLEKTFPEIVELAKGVFEKVIESKQGEVLTTCEMYSALECCQMKCLLNRSDKMRTFFHNHDACLRLRMDCSLCDARTSGLTDN